MEFDGLFRNRSLANGVEAPVKTVPRINVCQKDLRIQLTLPTAPLWTTHTGSCTYKVAKALSNITPPPLASQNTIFYPLMKP